MTRIGPGKEFVYGWAVLDENGLLPLPPPVLTDYGFSPGEPLVAWGGGSGPGGLSVCRLDRLRASALGVILERYPALLGDDQSVLVEGRSRFYARIPRAEGPSLSLSPEHLKAFGIAPSSRLLALRDSEIAVSFLGDGPMVEAAARIGDLPAWR